jgi:hypothetical protein
LIDFFPNAIQMRIGCERKREKKKKWMKRRWCELMGERVLSAHATGGSNQLRSIFDVDE